MRIVKLYQHLSNEKSEYIMSKQLLKCGTSVGANLREAKYAQSVKDFIAKSSVALKEISETEYWLELLFKTDYINKKEYKSIMSDCSQIAKILISSIKTTKKNNC